MNKNLSSADKDTLLTTLQKRFEANMHRHQELQWSAVEARLLSRPDILNALKWMEDTGGEPDVVSRLSESAAMTYCDCSKETPQGRRSLCYDQEALDSRKNHPPKDSAMRVADELGVGLLDEHMYRAMQDMESFDQKTSSWIATPDDVRKLGGALFGDRRFGRTFIYHNGADSYYAARGFRVYIEI